MTPNTADHAATAPFGERPTLRLLSLGLGGPSRPVARLLTRLAADDGRRWFESALARLPLGGANPRAFFLESRPGLDRLESLKSGSKRLANGDDEDTLAGSLGYLLATAWAMDLHGRFISTRPTEEVAGALLDLAQILGEPWEATLARAALRIEAAPGA